MSTLAKRLEPVVGSAPFVYGVMFLITLNAVVIGLETYPSVSARFGPLLGTLDRTILWLFVLEITIRWLAWTPRYRFLFDGWNLFDVIVIGAGFLPATTYLSVMRIFRVLRILRAVRVMPGMQRLVATLLKSIPALGHILLLMLILFYVYGVIGTFLFRMDAPHYFGSLHQSLLTLFQIATLEDWPDILEVLSERNTAAWIYVVSFILIGTFVLLNLVVGVIVSNMQAATHSRAVPVEADRVSRKDELAELQRSLTRIESQIASLSKDRPA